jgi:hypothetical protein
MTTSDSNETSENSGSARRELLLKVYSTSIDEYRFNVQLGWDRTKFFLLLNSGLVAAGVGLLKVAEDSVLSSSFLIMFFFLSILISIFGLETVNIAKAYYREAVFTKTLVERELGLLDPIPGIDDARANLSIAVTRGQRDHVAILSGRKRVADLRETPISRGSAAFYTQMVFWVMIVIESLGGLASVLNITIKATK